MNEDIFKIFVFFVGVRAKFIYKIKQLGDEESGYFVIFLAVISEVFEEDESQVYSIKFKLLIFDFYKGEISGIIDKR